MSNNQINEDTKVDLLNRIDSLDVLLGDIRESVQDAAGSLESLRSYVRALEADEKPALFVGSKPTFAVGGVAKGWDAELLPIGSRVENHATGYWEKTGKNEWTSGGGAVMSSVEVCVSGRKILRVGREGPRKTFTVGDMTEEGDGELLPIGSRIENYFAAYWEKVGVDEWLNEANGETWPSGALPIAGRKILRVGYGEPRRKLELGDILFTKEDFEAVPKGHVVVEIVSPTHPSLTDGERANGFHHYNFFVDNPGNLERRADVGHFYYLYGGEPVPPSDAEVPLREAFDAWGANAIVQPVRFPDIAFTLSPDGGAHYANGGGIEVASFQDTTVRLVAVLDDGKVIPEKVEKPKVVFKPGDVVRIYGGPFDGLKGHVLRVDLDLDNPHLVRAEGTTGFGRYEADDLSFSHRGYVIRAHQGDRLCNLWTGKTHTVDPEGLCYDARDYEFLMPKRVPKIGDVIDLRAARKLPVGSRVSVPGGSDAYWQKALSRRWFISYEPSIHPDYMSDSVVFRQGVMRNLLRYGHGDL